MRTSKIQINRQIFTVRILVVAILSTIFLYIYIVNSIAFNAAARSALVENTSILQSQINDAESRFISSTRGIDRSQADNFGLVKSVSNEALVVVRDSSTRLTLNDLSLNE